MSKQNTISIDMTSAVIMANYVLQSAIDEGVIPHAEAKEIVAKYSAFTKKFLGSKCKQDVMNCMLDAEIILNSAMRNEENQEGN